jgi:hypothetical protein
MKGDGAGGFAAPDPRHKVVIPAESTVNIGYPLVANLNVVDVNNDSHKDIVFSYQDYRIYVALGNGDGSYQYPTNVGGTQAYPTDLFVADVNGDGKLDLVDAEPGYLSIYPGKGDGTFDRSVISSYGSGMGLSSVLGVGDFTGDGISDVVLMDSFSDSVTLFPGVAGTIAALPAGQLVTTGDGYLGGMQATMTYWSTTADTTSTAPHCGPLLAMARAVFSARTRSLDLT